MTKFNVELSHNNHKLKTRFESEIDSVAQIIMALVACDPMWTSFTVAITPRGARRNVSLLLSNVKKSMVYESDLRKKLDAYFVSLEDDDEAVAA